jgi:hypothetical protein
MSNAELLALAAKAAGLKVYSVVYRLGEKNDDFG